ncbi:MAG: nucleotide exchange factor GrpE [Planctomycetes bacterium]|nr:nucleotide exchange factor GrpE [Planctomycetota bacterium]
MSDLTAPTAAEPPAPDPAAARSAAWPAAVAEALGALARDDEALPALARLHARLQPDGPPDLTAALEALLAARGLSAFPRGADEARADLDGGAPGYEVARAPSDEAPRGDVLRVERRGLRDASGAVLAPARVVVSKGPRDPLEAALADLEDVLRRTPVPQGAPALEVAAAREALARGEGADLAALCRALASADALGDEVVDLTLRDVYRLLRAAGVEALPAPGAGRLPPGAPRDEVEARDAPAPAGAVIEVRRRGFARGDEVLVAPAVVVSRGPRPALLRLLDRLAAEDPGPLATLAAFAADLAARVDAARDAHALAGAPAAAPCPQTGAPREALVAAALDLTRALERAGDALGALRGPVDALVTADLLPALAALDPEVEPLPPPGQAALDDPALYEVEEAHDERAPGALVAVRRVGLVDRRGGVRRVHPARVVVSLGPRSPLDLALDALLAAWPAAAAAPPRARTGRLPHGPPASAPDVEARARALRAAGREGDARQVAAAAAALLDLVEARADALDEALAALGQALGPRGVDVVDAPQDGPGLQPRHVFSDRPAGEALAVTRRALVVDGQVVRPGEVATSLGPRPALLAVADAVEPLLAGLPDDLRAPLAARVGLERAVEADLLAGRQPLGAGTSRDRAAALLDALDLARPSGLEALEDVLRGPLRAALTVEGLALLPSPGAPLDLAREDAVAEAEGRPSDAPRGALLEVRAHGLVDADDPGRVVRAARVVVSLGVDDACLAALDAALSAAREAAPAEAVALADLVERLRDPRAPLDEARALDALFEARAAASPAARAPLDDALRALGAEVFPAVGEAWSGEARRVFSDDAPAGQVLEVLTPGLRRGDVVLRPPEVVVSRGRPGADERALGEALEAARGAGADGDLARALDEAIERVAALPADDATALLVDLLGKLEDAGLSDAAAALVPALTGRGLRALPGRAGERWDEVAALAGDGAFEAPRKVLVEAPEGSIVVVDRRAVVAPGGVVRRGRVRVAAGPPSELSRLAEALRPGLEGALEGEARAAALAELDEVLERIAEAHAERGYLLALPLMTLLQRHDLKDKLGGELKEFLRRQGVKEIIAYPTYDANRLGVSRLEEVRVRSDRPKGKIVRVLRPGFERTTDGAVLQKVRAEVSR